MEPHPADPGTPPLPAEPPPWRAVWAHWPGSGEPLLLLASPGHPYHPDQGFTAEQADAWYCATSLRMSGWGGGSIVIPTLRTITVHVDDGALSLHAIGRPWLTPLTQGAETPGQRRAEQLGRTILGVMFTGPDPCTVPSSFHDLFIALHVGDALVGDVPVAATRTAPGPGAKRPGGGR